MKCLLFISCTLCIVRSRAANPVRESGGVSTQSRSQDAAGNYHLSYKVDSPSGGSFRDEKGSPGITEGVYGFHVEDGRKRVVKYVADGNGFRASVFTNEPGTVSAAPASSVIVSTNPDPAPGAAPAAVGAASVAAAEKPLGVAGMAPSGSPPPVPMADNLPPLLGPGESGSSANVLEPVTPRGVISLGRYNAPATVTKHSVTVDGTPSYIPSRGGGGGEHYHHHRHYGPTQRAVAGHTASPSNYPLPQSYYSHVQHAPNTQAAQGSPRFRGSPTYLYNPEPAVSPLAYASTSLDHTVSSDPSVVQTVPGGWTLYGNGYNQLWG